MAQQGFGRSNKKSQETQPQRRPSEDIRFRDVQLLMELLRIKSVRELSRATGTSPGQISKQIQLLEHKLGIKLVERSALGIEASPDSAVILPYLEKIHNLHLQLIGELKQEGKVDFLSFASSSFLTSHFLPRVLGEFLKTEPKSRFRIMDLQPSQYIPAALRGGFQFCLHIGDLDWPKTWTSVQVGNIIWELFCRFDHPLGKRPHLEDVLRFPFVYPAYWTPEGIRYGNDNCPLSIRKRQLGHETATAVCALELVRTTENLGFLPSILCRPYIEQKLLRKVTVKSWKDVAQPLYLTVKSDFVKQTTLKKLVEIIQRLSVDTMV